MGDFSMTCSISGLGIPGGTPVRCLLLTASPYNSTRIPWIVRTPPLRAVYDSYGSITEVHSEDMFVADLWLRGLREDLLEKGQGDNSVHDVPVAKNMSFTALLEVLRADRVEVIQDTKYFWHHPLEHDEMAVEKELPYTPSPSLRGIEHVLAKDPVLCSKYPDPISCSAATNKFVVDEPVPHLVRVRFGHYQRGPELRQALAMGREAIEQAGFVGVVAAGSGSYPDTAELLVFAAPNVTTHVLGPLWSKEHDLGEKALKVGMALVREDVWQALAHYPHADSVKELCSNCRERPWHHKRDRLCSWEGSIDNQPSKAPSEDSRYTHGPLFSKEVPHHIVPHAYGENVWYDLAAYRSGVHSVWKAILQYYEQPFMGELWQAPAKGTPHFSRFSIDHTLLPKEDLPGTWMFSARVPGVLGIPHHLSMCLADKREVPMSVLDGLAELAAVNDVLIDLGLPWKPAQSTGPQYPNWKKHLRFLRTLCGIAENAVKEENEDRMQNGDEEADLRTVADYSVLPSPPQNKAFSGIMKSTRAEISLLDDE